MSRQPSDANVISFSSVYKDTENNYFSIKVPKYQREQAWDLIKMTKLWDDMFLSCQRFNPASHEDPFFIGSIIQNNCKTANAEIVDGQQRITTLTIIASAIRDALLSTKNNELASKIHNDLLINQNTSKPLFVPLHLLPNPSTDKEYLSSRTRLIPYQNLIVPIFSGFTVKQIVDDTADEIEITGNSKWTGSFSKISISNNGKIKCDLELKSQKNFVMNQPSKIELKQALGDKANRISIDDEIWFTPDTFWWDDNKESDIYSASKNHFFHPPFRDFYILVRRQCESFILGSKKYIIDAFKVGDEKFLLTSENEYLLNLPEHKKIYADSSYENPLLEFPGHYNLPPMKFEISKKWFQNKKSNLKSKLELSGKFLSSSDNQELKSLKLSSHHYDVLNKQIEDFLDNLVPDKADNETMYPKKIQKEIEKIIEDYKTSHGGVAPTLEIRKDILKDILGKRENLKSAENKYLERAHKKWEDNKKKLEWEGVSLLISRPELITQQDHNSELQDRIGTLSALILDTTMVNIGFLTGKNISKPVKHFINTNDKSKMSPLETIDLLNAFVNQIVNNPYPQGQENEFQKDEAEEILKLWRKEANSIWNLIYLNQDKDTDFGSKFFYQYMIASCQFQDNGKRFAQESTYSGLDQVWQRSEDYRKSDGHYNLSYLVIKFKEMQKYAKMYMKIKDPGKFSLSHKAAKKHRSQLVMINSFTKNSQWIPPYLAILYHYDRLEGNAKHKKKMDEMCTLFLRNYNHMYLKKEFFSLAKEVVLFQSNTEHGKIDSESGWCYKIHEEMKKQGDNSPSKAIVNTIGNLPKELSYTTVPEWDSVDLSIKIPPKIKKIWYKISGESIDPFVWAYETSLQENGVLHETCQIEHIIPSAPSKWGSSYYDRAAKKPTELHKEWVENLGNKSLLEDSINNHIKNSPFNVKNNLITCSDPDCPGHYRNSGCKSSDELGPLSVFDAPKNVQKRNEKMMKAIIKSFKT